MCLPEGLENIPLYKYRIIEFLTYRNLSQMFSLVFDT